MCEGRAQRHDSLSLLFFCGSVFSLGWTSANASSLLHGVPLQLLPRGVATTLPALDLHHLLIFVGAGGRRKPLTEPETEEAPTRDFNALSPAAKKKKKRVGRLHGISTHRGATFKCTARQIPPNWGERGGRGCRATRLTKPKKATVNVDHDDKRPSTRSPRLAPPERTNERRDEREREREVAFGAQPTPKPTRCIFFFFRIESHSIAERTNDERERVCVCVCV